MPPAESTPSTILIRQQLPHHPFFPAQTFSLVPQTGRALPTHQRINALPCKIKGRSHEMEANAFDWSEYLSTEGLSDIGTTGLGMQDARAGLDG